MNARALIGVAVSMSLSLAGGITLGWWQWRHARVDGAARRLSANELWALPTYMQLCNTQSDCGAPLHCTYDGRVNVRRCIADACLTSLQCGPGTVCRAVPSLAGPPVHLCLADGNQQEGETCREFPTSRSEACADQLVCNYAYCGRPCQPGDAAGCPDGYACDANEHGLDASCVPSCMKSGCAAGARCIHIRGQLSSCGPIEGEDCERHPCPAGEECGRSISDKGGVFMWCRLPCDAASACPSGLVCREGDCRRLCPDGSRDACGPGAECGYSPQDHIAVCYPR